MRRTRRLAISPAARVLAIADFAARAAPEEQITWGVQATLAPTRGIRLRQHPDLDGLFQGAGGLARPDSASGDSIHCSSW